MFCFILLLLVGIKPYQAKSLDKNDEPAFLQPNIEEADNLYKQWLIAKAKPKTSSYCSCVNYAKALTGYQKPVGLAKNWPLNTDNPRVGDVIVLRESYAGHVAVITQITMDAYTVTEANYTPCAVGVRNINKNDNEIMGFYHD